MENKKINHKHNIVIFIFIGIIIFLFGIILCINKFNYKNKTEITGIIYTTHYHSGRTPHHTIFVQYEITGKEYISYFNVFLVYNSKFEEGNEITIWYDKNNPKNIGMKSLDLAYLIFPSMGFGLIIIGVLYYLLKGSVQVKNLQEIRNIKFKVIEKIPIDYDYSFVFFYGDDDDKYVIKTDVDEEFEKGNIYKLQLEDENMLIETSNISGENAYFIKIDASKFQKVIYNT